MLRNRDSMALTLFQDHCTRLLALLVSSQSIKPAEIQSSEVVVIRFEIEIRVVGSGKLNESLSIK